MLCFDVNDMVFKFFRIILDGYLYFIQVVGNVYVYWFFFFENKFKLGDGGLLKVV